MIKLRAFSHRILLGALFARVLSVVPAQAQEETAPESPAPENASAVPAPSEQTEPAADREGAEEALGLEVLLSNSGLQVEAIQLALEEELLVRTRLTDQGQRLRLRVEGASLDAAYGDPQGRIVSRHVELPADEAQALELIALLCGNLVRDEAHAVLERLRKTQPTPKTETPSADPTSATTPTRTQSPPAEQPRKHMPVSLTLLSPVSTDPKLAEHEAHFNIGAFYSDMGRLEGVAVEGGVLRARDGGRGLLVAGIGSTSGPFEGLNVSGIFGVDAGARGLSVAGLYLRHERPFQGLSVSLVNQATAAAPNDPEVTDFTSRGAMIGLVNVGANVVGTQIGLINVQTGSMRGAQIGLINVSRDLKGAAIGLLNLGPSVRIQPLAWVSMNPELDHPARQAGPMAHLGVKYRIRQFYSFVSFGVAAEASGCGTDPACTSSDALIAPGFGAGYAFPLGQAFALELDGLYQVEVSPRGAGNAHETVAGRLSALWKANEQVSFFVGGGPRLVIPDFDEEQTHFGPTFHAGIQLF